MIKHDKLLSGVEFLETSVFINLSVTWLIFIKKQGVHNSLKEKGQKGLVHTVANYLMSI